jgi:hypothetical protein
MSKTKFYYVGRRVVVRDENGNLIGKNNARALHNKAARRVIRRQAFIGRRSASVAIVDGEATFADRKGLERLPPIAIQLIDLRQYKAEINKLASNSHEFRRLWALALIERRDERRRKRVEKAKGWGMPR